MNPKNLKFLSSRESIPTDISMLENFDIDHLKRYWKVFKTSSNVLPGGHRLENLFWRMWGSEKLHKTLSGSRIAILFMMIRQGEEAFERTPRLRIPEFGKAVHTRIQPTPRLPPCASLKIPPTPPPSPIESQFTGPGGRPPMSRFPSQGEIAKSLQQAVLQLRQISVRPSPPNPPPPSPATPMASPLLAVVQAKLGQTGYFIGSERPVVVSSNSDNTMMNVNSAAIAPPRNPPRPSNPTRKSSNSTLPVVEERLSNAPPTTQQKDPKRSESAVSIAESTTSATSAKVGKQAGMGGKHPKKGTLPKGKAKFAAGKKGGLRPALVRQKSNTSSTVVEDEEEEGEGEYDGLTEAKRQITMQQKPLVEEAVNLEEGLVVTGKKPIGALRSIVAEIKETGEKAKEPGMKEVPVAEKVPAAEVVSDIEEEGDEFEDEEDPKRRTYPRGRKNKKGSSTRLSKKNRNVSASAGKAAPGLGIAAALGGPGTRKEVEAPAPLPVVSIVEPDFRRKFQERNNITCPASEDGISVYSGNSSPGSSVSVVESNGKGKRREKLVFLTSDMEARIVKCQPTVSIATPASSVVVAKMHGQNVLMVQAGEIRGLNSQRTPVATRKVEIVNLNGVNMGGSAGGGSGKSALSLMIEDAKRRNGGKVGGDEKGSLGGS
ncbi:hypothetical protein BGX38DRAFT_1140886 [Terfezia claveryi]|nr:hypothetical protein BGX38DRAFT_1140886 [Terfezia claveryi]